MCIRKAIDKYFICERLTARDENKQLIQNFESALGAGLVRYLKEEAWEEDALNKNAVYIVRTKKNKIAFFFSLKCGIIYDALDEEKLKLFEDCYSELVNDTEKKNSIRQIERLKQKNLKISIEKKKKYKIVQVLQYKHDQVQFLNSDREIEQNENISRVKATHPSIELAHFCSNDAFKVDWRVFAHKHNIKKSIGRVIFWYYIAKIACDLQQNVGCEFVHLFAADEKDKIKLVNYYKAFDFYRPKNLGVVKPFYDFTCKFMCKPIFELSKQREEYLKKLHMEEDKK